MSQSQKQQPSDIDAKSPQLCFATLDEIVEELCKRYPIMGLVTYRSGKSDSTLDTSFNFMGPAFAVVGLLDNFKCILRAHSLLPFTDQLRRKAQKDNEQSDDLETL